MGKKGHQGEIQQKPIELINKGVIEGKALEYLRYAYLSIPITKDQRDKYLKSLMTPHNLKKLKGIYEKVEKTKITQRKFDELIQLPCMKHGFNYVKAFYIQYGRIPH